MVMMSGISEEQKKKDFQMMLACSTHLGTKNLDFQMTRYVWKRKPDGIHIINLGRTYDKLMMAARVIVAIENPADVCVISARPYGQRSILKYGQYTGATPIAGRFTPGTFSQFPWAFVRLIPNCIVCGNLLINKENLLITKWHTGILRLWWQV